MKCSKCGSEIKNNDKFCTKCGTPVTNNTVNQKLESTETIQEDKYVIKKDYNVMWGMVGIAFIISIAFLVIGLGFPIYVIVFELVIYGLMVAAGAFNNLVFKCPNCKEEIILREGTLKTVNENEMTGQCPKCSQELIFNNKKLSINRNSTIRSQSNNNSNISNNTSKIEELYNLKTKGIITEEEFEKKKQELLNKI